MVVATALAPALARFAPVRLPPRLSFRGRLHALTLLRFARYFVAESLRGGVDVALRALRPSMPLAPGFIRYRWRLPVCDARWLVVNTVSLLRAR